MSRSKKKPIFTDQQRSRKSASAPSRSVWAKRQANRAVRRANAKACKESEKDEITHGKAYRRKYNPYNIRDYSFYCPKDKKAKRK